MPAFGRHEVIVESPGHDDDLGDLSVERFLDVFEMVNRRVKALESLDGVRYVSVFKNRGAKAGASLAHTHIQLIALPINPTLVLQEMEGSWVKGSCGFCKVLVKELKGGRRILSSKHSGAFAPFASRHPMEAWVMPKRHVGRLSDLSPAEAEDLAESLKYVLDTLNTKLDYPPYNLIFHASPRRGKLHFHFELCPKLSILAGYEVGSGGFINTVPPKDAARFYRT